MKRFRERLDELIICHNGDMFLFHFKSRVTILGPKPKLYGVLVQWAQYNEFVENGLETWILANQTIDQQVLMIKKER